MDIQTRAGAMNRTMKRLLWLVTLLGGVAHANTVTYVYTDPQGTPLAEANASGTITATYDYAPYGSQAMGAAHDGPGYTGHVSDADTGLVYMQARYYDPAVGRFLSVDPAGPKPGGTFNFNRYIYGNDNPIENTDPNGKTPMSEKDAITLASTLNQKSGSSGTTGMYAVVHPESGPNGYTVQTSQQAAQEHAGLSSQAATEYGAKSNATSQAICAVPAIATALVAGDMSKSSTAAGVNELKGALDAAGKMLEIAKAAPNESVAAFAKGLSAPSLPLHIALAVPAAIDNQAKCVSENTKDYINRQSTADQREQ